MPTRIPSYKPNSSESTLGVIHSHQPGKINSQARLAQIVEMVIALLAKMSLHDKEKITFLKKEIKQLTNDQASSILKQGWISLGTAIGGAVFTGLSFMPALSSMKDAIPKIGDLICKTTGDMLGAQSNVEGVKSSSAREVLMRDMDNKNNEVQAEAGSRRDVKETLQQAQQTLTSASRQH